MHLIQSTKIPHSNYLGETKQKLAQKKKKIYEGQRHTSGSKGTFSTEQLLPLLTHHLCAQRKKSTKNLLKKGVWEPKSIKLVGHQEPRSEH